MNIDSGPTLPSIAAPKAPLYPTTFERIWKGYNDTDTVLSGSDAPNTCTLDASIHTGRGSRPTWRTPLGKFAIGWSAAQMLLVVILEAVVLTIHNNEIQWITNVATSQAPSLLNSIVPNEKAVTLYHAIYVAAQVFQFLLAVDAVVSSSTIQLISTTVFNWVLTVYAVVQYWQTRSLAYDATLHLAQSGVKASLHWSMIEEFVVIGTMIVFALGWIYLTFKLHRQFGWSIFKELGADVATKRQLTLYHIFFMLLKVDVFFFNGFTIQYLVLVLLGNADQITILFHACFVTPVTIPLLILAYYAIRRESRILMVAFLMILVGGTVYVISRLVDIFTTTDRNKYLASKSSLSLFESVVIVLAIVTIVIGYLNLRNFGHGLRDQLRQSAATRAFSIAGVRNKFKKSHSGITLSSILKYEPPMPKKMAQHTHYAKMSDNSAPLAYAVNEVARFNEPSGAILLQNQQFQHQQQQQHQQFVAHMLQKQLPAISSPLPSSQMMNRPFFDLPGTSQWDPIGLSPASIPTRTPLVIGPNRIPLTPPKRKYTPQQLEQQMQLRRQNGDK